MKGAKFLHADNEDSDQTESSLGVHVRKVRFFTLRHICFHIVLGSLPGLRSEVLSDSECFFLWIPIPNE